MSNLTDKGLPRCLGLRKLKGGVRGQCKRPAVLLATAGSRQLCGQHSEAADVVLVTLDNFDTDAESEYEEVVDVVEGELVSGKEDGDEAPGKASVPAPDEQVGNASGLESVIAKLSARFDAFELSNKLILSRQSALESRIAKAGLRWRFCGRSWL